MWSVATYSCYQYNITYVHIYVHIGFVFYLNNHIHATIPYDAVQWFCDNSERP